jgi:hypothetical protein
MIERPAWLAARGKFLAGAPPRACAPRTDAPALVTQISRTKAIPMLAQVRRESRSSTLTRRGSTRRRPPPASRLCLEAMERRWLLSTLSVLNFHDSGPGSLRGAITAANTAPGADLIRFAPAARNGTIALTGGQLSITDDLVIDGPGADRLAVSGNDASRVFQIIPGAAVRIDGLTVTRGRAVGQGGGILNAGTLTLADSVLSDNQVVGLPGASLGTVVDAFGAGIFNAGSLAVRHSDFIHNRSIGADGTPASIGSSALGGAIMSNGTPSAPATVTVSDSTFLDNEALGGAAGAGASRAGIGGAISNATGTFTVSNSLFHDNQAVGGLDSGVPGGFGAGSGGAIGNVARLGDAVLSVSRSTFTNNRAVGGAGTGALQQDGRGGAIASYVFPGLPSAAVTATATVSYSVILGNQAIGGAGTTGGNGQGGGIANPFGGVLTVSNSLVALNRAVGGAGNGGDGQGGGIFNGGPSRVGTPSLTLQRSLLVFNQASGGAVVGGSAGSGVGGGLYLSPGGAASADAWTFIRANDASTSDDDVFGVLG